MHDSRTDIAVRVLHEQVVPSALQRWMMRSSNSIAASPDHLDMLPPETLICLVSAPARIRHQRLIARAETSQRKWVDGKASAREDALPELIRQARKRFRVVRIKNAGNTRAHVVHAVTEILVAIS